MTNEKYEPTGHDSVYLPNNISAPLQNNYKNKTTTEGAAPNISIKSGGIDEIVNNTTNTFPTEEQKNAQKTNVKYEPVGFHPCYAILPE